MAGATVPFWIDAGSQLLILVVMFVVLWRSRMHSGYCFVESIVFLSRLVGPEIPVEEGGESS